MSILSNVTLLQLLVLIDRDTGTKIPTTIQEYEQSILEDVYGEDSVIEVSSEPVVHESFDVGVAFESLVAKYRSNSDADAARSRLFGRARDLERYVTSRQGDVPKGGSKPKGKGKSKAAKAGEASLSDEAVGTLLDQDEADVVAALAGLSAADLLLLEAAETDGQCREAVLAAIDDESEKLKS